MAVTPSQIEVKEPYQDTLREFRENIPPLSEAPSLVPDYEELDYDPKNPKPKTTAETNNEAASGFHDGGHAHHINHVNNESAEGALKGNEAEEAKNRRARVIINQVNSQIAAYNQELSFLKEELTILEGERRDAKAELVEQKGELRTVQSEKNLKIETLQDREKQLEETIERKEDLDNYIEGAQQQDIYVDEFVRRAAREGQVDTESLQEDVNELNNDIADLTLREQGLQKIIEETENHLESINSEIEITTGKIAEIEYKKAVLEETTSDPDLRKAMENGMSFSEAASLKTSQQDFIETYGNDYEISIDGDVTTEDYSITLEQRSIELSETLKTLENSRQILLESHDIYSSQEIMEKVLEGNATYSDIITPLPEDWHNDAYNYIRENFDLPSFQKNSGTGKPKPLDQHTDTNINVTFNTSANQNHTPLPEPASQADNMTRFDPDKLSQNLQQFGMSRSASLTPGS